MRLIQKIKNTLSYFNFSNFLYFLLLIALNSCEENYEVLPEIPKPECFPISVVKSGGVEVTRGNYQLEYDSEGRLIKYLENDSTLNKFEFENNRVVRISSYYKNDETQLKYVSSIHYNSKGQWVKIEYTDPEMRFTTAEYDHEGYLIKTVNGRTTEKSRTVCIYKYSGGNLIKLKQIIYDEAGSKLYEYQAGFSYDLTRENKLKYIHTQLLLVEQPNLGTVLWHTASNNMVKTSISYVDDSQLTVYHNYEYDDKGFPIKCTLSGVDYNQDGTIDENDTAIILSTFSCP